MKLLLFSKQITIDHTYNVFCTTKAGDENNIVMAGAHLGTTLERSYEDALYDDVSLLDSVPEGPGMNDNGSGSSSVLELVIQMARLDVTPKNKV